MSETTTNGHVINLIDPGSFEWNGVHSAQIRPFFAEIDGMQVQGDMIFDNGETRTVRITLDNEEITEHPHYEEMCVCLIGQLEEAGSFA